MNVISPYFHALNGRLRIKIVELKGLPMKALEAEGQLRVIDGIKHVKANPTTGNVLVLYDPAQIGQEEILGALQRLGYLRENGQIQAAMRHYPQAFEGIGETLARTLMHTTMEVAVQSLISALI